jgi:hypothetical protein
VTLRQEFAAAAGPNALVALHNRTFLFGPSFALGPNTLMLAYLMCRSRLVSRFIATLGLIGGPRIFASAIAVLFGLHEQVSTWGAIAAVPVFAWEMSLAIWLIVNGFKPSPIIPGDSHQVAADDGRPPLATAVR